jgi:BMFP domain-containing protein YqiC
MEARQRGELVDRLMQRIGELEAKLYDKQLAESQFTIPAIHGER